jgi:thioredoxin reductase
MAKPGLIRVVVLGAGPIGLEAALQARSLGLPVTVYEQGQPGEYLNRWGFVRMFTPFGWNVSPLGLQTLLRENPQRELPAESELLTGRAFREKYLQPLADSAFLKPHIKLQTTAVSIGRTGWRKSDDGDAKKALPSFRLLLREQNGTERFDTADVILDCTGTYARPNWVGDGGIPAMGEIAARSQVAYWLDDVRGARVAHYAGKSIAIIGSGYSAATMATELATLANDHQSTWIIWLTHGPRTQPIPRLTNDPLKERDRLATKANHLAMRCDGNLEYHPQTQIDELISHGPDKGFRITARIAGKPMNWDVERVIANVGYRPDLGLAAELRVSEPHGVIVTDEPGYFILGAKSRGRDSSFLIRDGIEQVRHLFRTHLGFRIAA